MVPGVFQGCIQNGLIRSLWASKPLICALGVKQRKALCFIPASQVLRHGVVHRILHRGRCLAGQVVVDVNPKAWNGQAGCFTSTLCEGRAFWAWGPLGGRHWAALSCWRACVGCYLLARWAPTRTDRRSCLFSGLSFYPSATALLPLLPHLHLLQSGIISLFLGIFILKTEWAVMHRAALL